MNDKNLKKIGDFISVKIRDSLRLITTQQSTLRDKIEMVYTRLETMDEKLDAHDNKLDAQTVDIHDLQEGVKGLQDEVVANTQINKRRIDEIPEHVGLPASSLVGKYRGHASETSGADGI